VSPRDQKSIAAGTVLDGKYRVDAQVGAGGMGAVYLATHTTIGRRVAIKTLHAELTSDEQVVARFHREAQLAGSIGHDNICEVTDIGTLENGSPYLVMPMLNGTPLADLLEQGELLSMDRVVDMIGQTLSALEAAHGAGIVHRDLKPDNIFITRMGDRADFVKLLDFGISKIMEQDEVTALTMTGTVLGTPFYMAPEQAKGAKDLDHRVDIYAMGVILYEALTGARPFTGESYNEIMFKIIAEPFALPSTLNPSISPAIEQVICRAMARDPALRYGSASEMKAALESAAQGTAIDFDTRWSNAPTMSASGPYTPARLTAPLTPTPMGTVTSSTSAGVRGRERRGKAPIIVGVSVGVAVLAAVAGFVVMNLIAEEPPPLVVPATPAPEVVQPAVPMTTAPVAPPQAQPDPPVVGEAVAPATAAVEGGEAAEPEKEAAVNGAPSKRKKSKKASSDTSVSKTSIDSKSPDAKDKGDAVKGRFGTTFVGDYDE